MDSGRFDELARRLDWPHSRRRTLGAVVGGGLAALLGREEPAAACAPVGKRCKKKNGREQKCCGGAKCVRTKCRCANGQQNSGGVCAKAPACRGRLTVCTSDSECCSDACVSVSGLHQVCIESTVGGRCRANDDCGGLDERCVGFQCRCRKGTTNSDGICAKKPTCRRANAAVTGSTCDTCCSTTCSISGGSVRCALSEFGERCQGNDDCADGLNCRAFECSDSF